MGYLRHLRQLPLCHMLLLGAVMSFWELVLGKVCRRSFAAD